MPWEKQFDVDDALTRAMEVFWSKGYEAASMQDLLVHMGINRGSLYDTFGNKRRLFLKALRHYQATYLRSRVAAAARGRTPKAVIGAMFEMLVADALGDNRRSGCLLVNTALERAPHDAEVAAVVAEGLGEIEAFFAATIRQGRAAGEIPEHVDAVEAARGLLGLMLGMRVLARSLPEETVLRSIAGQAMAMLE